ncbi:MAG: cobalamin B12-binding domain-containing protein [Candidatus Omnitrophica bacterium]|nr:cobalamin B12-binding domain-containing protein [Candidatus Omnitrophota bacterium]
MAHVTLIRPPLVVSRWCYMAAICPPIGPAYLASTLLAAGHDVRLIDALGEGLEEYHPCAIRRDLYARGLSIDAIVQRIPAQTDVIGISCMFTQEWPLIQALLAAIRARFPTVPLVAGNEHITAAPGSSLASSPALDYCVLGEGEATLRELVDVLKHGGDPGQVPGLAFRREGGVLRTPPRIRIKAVDEIPPPAWELTPLASYLDGGYGFGVNRGRSMPILASRGCPYQCTFCSNPAMWTTRWYPRHPRQVVEEMERYVLRYRAQNFDFYDLTAIVKKSWIVEFAQLLIQRQLGVSWQLPSGTRSEAIDEEVAPLLYRSGCRNISYAPESGSASVLARIKKHVNLPRMQSSMRATRRAGLNVKAHIVIGFPDEWHQEIWATLGFILKMAWLGVHDITIAPYSPYPGAELFEQLRAAGKIRAFDAAYFRDLYAFTDIANTVSYCDRVSSRRLGGYRTFGLLSFYAVQYLLRPWRLARTLRNLITRRHESRLEMSLDALLKRLRAPRPSAAASSAA